MDFLLLKIILLIIMGLIPLVFGLLPIKLLSYLKKVENDDIHPYRKSSMYISILSCFAGGVILGVAFIEMLPEARADLEHLADTNPFYGTYPFVELLVGLGIFLVYFVEEFVAFFSGSSGHAHAIPNQKIHAFESEKKNGTTSPINTHGHCCNMTSSKITNLDIQDTKSPNYHSITTSTQDSKTNTLSGELSPSVYSCVSDTESQKSNPSTTAQNAKAITGAFTFILALFVHTSLEGFAFGVGMSLLHTFPSNIRLVVTLIGMLSLFSPIGGVLGIIIEAVNIHSDAKGLVTVILTCLSIGTFFYIAFFEILSPEREKPYPKLLQWFGCTSGYVLMAIVMSFAHHSHEHSAKESAHDH